MTTQNLKRDALGTTRLVETGDAAFIERDTRTAHAALRAHPEVKWTL